jgi:L-serine dehydratase
MFTIGIGPSSSHTVGPMRAARKFVEAVSEQSQLEHLDYVHIDLYGSLGLTGKGHGTDVAVFMGLEGNRPSVINPEIVPSRMKAIRESGQLNFFEKKLIKFKEDKHITFHRRKSLPKHSNALTFKAYNAHGDIILEQTYYSVGGGFIVGENDIKPESSQIEVPYPFSTGGELLEQCKTNGLSISTLMLENEKAFRSEEEINQELTEIWSVMDACIAKGCEKEGILPGGLKVKRRAPSLFRKLKAEQHTRNDPLLAMDWVDLYAMAVNEENAAGGRVVTAPTNGAAGIIPAVLKYHEFSQGHIHQEQIVRFLLTAAAIGIIFNENASISGAEVGCQGEVGVACSMAAGALVEIMGGTPEQVENASEIGMEHNLGLTCDPVGGLVQIPCIERNAMGAVKAINACRLALRGDGSQKVSLDKVIKTMLETGRDMKSKYKETARGGLAVNIIEC